MNDQNLEQRIREAVEHATPDKLQQILSSCDQQKGPVITMTNPKKRNWATPIVAAAASLVMVLTGAFGYGWYNARSADARILLDVNPSISLTVNAKEKVLDVDALNDDAKKILGDMNLKGTQLDVAVNALIGSMLQNGYLDELQNSILVSVENADADKALQLQQKVADAINAPFTDLGLEAAVLSQSVTEDAELDALAQANGISVGKAALIQKVIALDPTLTAESLSPLSVNELSLILNSRQDSVNALTQTGTSSAKAYITADEAKAAAYAHAGVKEADVSRSEAKLDSEDGIMVYEVEFFCGNVEYEYDIDARTADVVKSSRETRHSAGTGTSDTTVSITEERAKEIAFTHAGVKETDVTGLITELDYGWYYTKYDIDFFVGGKEYEYEIDASSGAVLEYSIENSSAASSPSVSSGMISQEEAKKIAFNHAGVKEADVSGLEMELDYGWYHTKYEIEFYVSGREYEYEIDASSGDILEFSAEGGVPSGNTSSGNTSSGSTSSGSTSSGSTSSGTITTAEAKKIAFAHAGVKEADVTGLKVDLDWDDGRQEYDLDFYAGGKEYDYTIDASSGTILEHSVEGKAASSGTSSSTGSITTEEAKAIAFQYAGVTESQVTGLEIDRDDEDGRPVYEIEFSYGKRDFECTILASDGTILKAEWDD